jgi:hypothetical protein
MTLVATSVPDEIAHCGNEISCTIQTSLLTNTPNLKIQCYLQVEIDYMSNTHTIWASQILDPDSNGNCKFFWDRYLWDSFQNNFDVPILNDSSEFQLQHIVKRYALFAVELSGSPQTTTDTLASGDLSSIRFAVKGAIPKHRLKERPFFGATGWNLQASGQNGLGKAFLDWRSPSVSTPTGSEQWLYWLWQDPGSIFGSLSGVKYFVKYYRSDGLTNRIEVLTTPLVDVYSHWGFPAGFNQLNLSQFETALDKITKYETFVAMPDPINIGQFIDLSERKLWYVDRKHYPQIANLSYINSLGCLTQFQLKGEASYNVVVDKKVSPHYWDQAYTMEHGESSANVIHVDNQGIMATGVLSRNEATQFQDIIASPKVLLTLFDQRLPIVLKNAKIPVKIDDNLYSYKLEFSYDYNDSVADTFIVRL